MPLSGVAVKTVDNSMRFSKKWAIKANTSFFTPKSCCKILPILLERVRSLWVPESMCGLDRKMVLSSRGPRKNQSRPPRRFRNIGFQSITKPIPFAVYCGEVSWRMCMRFTKKWNFEQWNQTPRFSHQSHSAKFYADSLWARPIAPSSRIDVRSR